MLHPVSSNYQFVNNFLKNSKSVQKSSIKISLDLISKLSLIESLQIKKKDDRLLIQPCFSYQNKTKQFIFLCYLSVTFNNEFFFLYQLEIVNNKTLWIEGKKNKIFSSSIDKYDFFFCQLFDIWFDYRKILVYSNRIESGGVFEKVNYSIWLVGFMMLNATFNNISVISWQSVLLVEETRVSGENYWSVASHW